MAFTLTLFDSHRHCPWGRILPWVHLSNIVRVIWPWPWKVIDPMWNVMALFRPYTWSPPDRTWAFRWDLFSSTVPFILTFYSSSHPTIGSHETSQHSMDHGSMLKETRTHCQCTTHGLQYSSTPSHCPQMSPLHPNVRGVEEKGEKDKKSIWRPMVPPLGTMGKNICSFSFFIFLFTSAMGSFPSFFFSTPLTFSSHQTSQHSPDGNCTMLYCVVLYCNVIHIHVPWAWAATTPVFTNNGKISISRVHFKQWANWQK